MSLENSIIDSVLC